MPRPVWCACAPRWPPWPRRSTTPFRRPGARTYRSARACGRPSTGGRCGAGWSTEEVGAPAGVDLLPLKSWLGWGPPAGLVDLAEWAAWRWAGPASFFLSSASPETIVRALPAPPAPPGPAGFAQTEAAATGDVAPGDLDLAQEGVTVVRQPPLTDPIALVLSVVGHPAVRARAGSVLVLVPSTGWAERLTARLERRGCPTAGTWERARAGWPVVVGNRAGAWAPVPRLAAVVVLDAHDAAYREESAPTYSAVEVLLERARRESVACLLVSPVPPVALAAWPGPLRTVAPTRPEERAGWPILERVDRRGADPRSGMFSEEFVRLARSVLDDEAARQRGPLVCVYNRTGGARLLACRHCGELARCARCGAARGTAARGGSAAVPTLRRDPPGRVRGVRPAAHEDRARRREPTARGVGRAPRRRRGGGGRSAWGGRASAGPRRHPSSSAPRRCCTGFAAPPPWRSSTSTCTCWPRGSPRPRTRWRCSSGPPGWSGCAARGRPGRVCRPRRGCRTTPCCRRWRGGSRRRCWRRKWQSAAPRRLPPFAALAVVSGALAPAYTETLRREAGEGLVADGCRRVGGAARRRSVPLARRHPRSPL